MKLIHVEQGSPEWLQLRLGIPTASAFDRVMTPKKLQLSSQAVGYRNQLLAEWLLGYPIDWSGAGAFMDRGTDLEPRARAFYEMQFDVEVAPGGFVLRDDELVGGSPDGLVGPDGGVEFKCPAIHTHIGYLVDHWSLVADYVHQVQGLLYLTGRAWWDLVSYHPDLPAVIQRVERDERFIEALDTTLGKFLADLEESKGQLTAVRLAAAEEATDA